MNWKKLKKAIIPLIIVKLIILVFFISRGDAISISRDPYYSSNYQQGFDNDSVVLKKQKFIRIVRNEDERGISIILRARKNARPLREKEREMNAPLVD